MADKNYISGVYPILCSLVKEVAKFVSLLCECTLLQIAQMLLAPMYSRFLTTYSLVTQSSPEILTISLRFLSHE